MQGCHMQDKLAKLQVCWATVESALFVADAEAGHSHLEELVVAVHYALLVEKKTTH